MPVSSVDALWWSSNPPFGKVRAVLVDTIYAVAFDDLNADDREVELRLYEQRPEGWVEVLSIDDAEMPDDGLSYAWQAGYLLFWAEDRPGARVERDFHGVHISAQADRDGFWFAVVPDRWEGWPADGC